ncbi:cytochrome O ubiquinol oxidase [Acidiferrobacter sp. SPIII_3]|nr:cytochrome O ubiquinol oxidase [Acidiferrobacter sp. SPIII_3]
MIVSSLFASYLVLNHRVNAAAGPTAGTVVHPVVAFFETVLLFSGILAYGFAMVGLKRGDKNAVLSGLAGAIVLGAGFLVVEGVDFAGLALHGMVPERSGFLSAFYTLVLYHGAHLVFGILWTAVMMVQVVREGFTQNVVYRLLNLKLFWFFQGFLWIYVFSFVYLTGALHVH